MRVLDTTTFELHSGEQKQFKQDGYAILSHRWVGQEITFDQLPTHTNGLKNASEQSRLSPQLEKIRGACDTARNRGIRWMWIDTCCINKASTVEETESINSMFRWYRDAKVCITYLFDVDVTSSSSTLPEKSSSSIFQRINSDQPSEWFTRGWTLQELLAPRNMQFYDAHWTYMGTKTELASALEQITGIDEAYLTGAKHFRKACIATKLSWQAGRTTAREEDIAYSMLGIFNIIMTPQYGEGSRAFMRLQQALLTTTTDESLFAWRMPNPSAGEKYDIEHNTEMSWGKDEWGFLAPTPEWFKGCGNVTIEGGPKIERPGKGFQMTRQGLEVMCAPAKGFGKYKALLVLSTFLLCLAPVVLVLVAKRVQKHASVYGVPFTLNCWVRNDAGQLAAVEVYVQIVGGKMFVQAGQVTLLRRMRCSELGNTVGYNTQATDGTDGFVVQPELSYGD